MIGYCEDPDQRRWFHQKDAELTKSAAMDTEALSVQGKRMIDFVVNHWKTLRDRRIIPDVTPGYINSLMPAVPPDQPEEWDTIFEDIEKVVMGGHAHWSHPHFFAYFGAFTSYSSLIAEILSDGIGGVGFSWQSCPSMTELEQKMLDWLVAALGLPEHFKHSHLGPGCGVIQPTATTATLIATLTARSRMVETLKTNAFAFASKGNALKKTVKYLQAKWHQQAREDEDTEINMPESHDSIAFEHLIAYSSDQAHLSISKSAMLCGVKLRQLKSIFDASRGVYTVTVQTLQDAIRIRHSPVDTVILLDADGPEFDFRVQKDHAAGRIPFVFLASVGYTSTCGVDYVKDLGPVCNAEGIWLHVDAAYAGSFLICPEFRYMSEGMEMVDSFNFNAHKALYCGFDCSPLWFKDGYQAKTALTVRALYVKHAHADDVTDIDHLEIGMGRRFRSLKLWLTLRSLGIEKIQNGLRDQIVRAARFEELVVADSLLELFVPRHLGLVCFRVRGLDNSSLEALCASINSDGRIYIVPAEVRDEVFLRFTVTNENTTEEDIDFAFRVVKEMAQAAVDEMNATVTPMKALDLNGNKMNGILAHVKRARCPSVSFVF